MPRSPADCETMAELRLEIDAIDDALIELLIRRAGYIDRAVTLKRREGLPPRTSARVAEVIGHVRERAAAQMLDPDLAETLWITLIDWGIAREASLMGVTEAVPPYAPRGRHADLPAHLVLLPNFVGAGFKRHKLVGFRHLLCPVYPRQAASTAETKITRNIMLQMPSIRQSRYSSSAQHLDSSDPEEPVASLRLNGCFRETNSAEPTPFPAPCCCPS